MTPEYGAASQLEKINMLDYADVIAINKFDKAGALDALHDVRKQYKRNHGLWTAKDDELPVVGTIAAQFNDQGINELFEKLVAAVGTKTGVQFGNVEQHAHVLDTTTKSQIIPPSRVRYLAEIAENNRSYDSWAAEQSAIATKLYQINGIIGEKEGSQLPELQDLKKRYEEQLHPECKKLMEGWPQLQQKYAADFLNTRFATRSSNNQLLLPR
jgi:methylmalonyl-CoA mutase